MRTSSQFHGALASGLSMKKCSFPWNYSKKNPIRILALSYQKWVEFAIQETQLKTHLTPLHHQEKFRCMKSLDGKAEVKTLCFEAPKIRLFRSLVIDGNSSMQVLDFAAFPKLEYDLPIFCANIFTASNLNIVVLDLNPLHHVITNKEYKEKYYQALVPLGNKYSELLPWGDKITSESIQFFSPIVIWTKFASSPKNHDILFSAFKEYFKAWLQLIEQAEADSDPFRISCNQEAQHRYLTWRAEKDPGQLLLQKLLGEQLAQEMVKDFLFYGVNSMGSKTFLDFFPEYRTDDGTVSKKRSIVGKSFETRPWNQQGEFIG